MDRLEDNAIDIIQKARQGLNLSLYSISNNIGLSVKELVAIEDGLAPIIEEFSKALGLSFKKLLSIYNNGYMPEPIAMENIAEGLTLKFFEVEIGGIISNGYLLIKKDQALLIDSAGAASKALLFLKTQHITPKALLITHGHFDHTAGIETIKQQYIDVPIIYAGRDIAADGQLTIAGFDLKVFKTPGHTEDSVCYFVNNVIIFVGDTIFAGSVGRPNYNYQQLLANIKSKIFVLDADVVIAPGHGPQTTVGEEKENNPFF